MNYGWNEIVLLLQNSVNQHIFNLIFYYSIVLSMYLILLELLKYLIVMFIIINIFNSCCLMIDVSIGNLFVRLSNWYTSFRRDFDPLSTTVFFACGHRRFLHPWLSLSKYSLLGAWHILTHDSLINNCRVLKLIPVLTLHQLFGLSNKVESPYLTLESRCFHLNLSVLFAH